MGEKRFELGVRDMAIVVDRLGNGTSANSLPPRSTCTPGKREKPGGRCSELQEFKFFCETTIFIYNDNADHLIVMYLIIRCPSCSTFTYVDRFQKWKLCPQCGHAQEIARTPAYLDVEDFHEAEHIVKQMQKHLHANKKKDFSPEETVELRHHYTEALRKRGRGYPVQ